MIRTDQICVKVSTKNESIKNLFQNANSNKPRLEWGVDCGVKYGSILEIVCVYFILI